MFQSEQDHRDWKAQAMGLLPGSTFFDLLWWVHRWNQVFFQPMPECIGCPTGHQMFTPPTGLLGWLYQTAVLGATGGRPRQVPRPAAALA